jgi:hypothetical protein
MAQEDVERLSRFLLDLENLLQSVASDPSDLIFTSHRDRLQDAWLELRSRNAFERLQIELRQGDLDSELEQRGLTGAQLALKLEGFYYWREQELQDAPAVRPESFPEPPRRRRRRWFRRALEWANIPLGSLASIVALSAFVDPVQEMKDSFLQASHDREAQR